MLYPEQVARELLSRAWDGRLPVDIEGLARAFDGVKVERAPLDGISGETRLEPDGYRIRVNSTDGEKRQRFTLAHELGHVLLGHVSASAPVLRDPKAKGTPVAFDAHERDANLFAASVLMPGDAVRAAIHEGLNLDRLARLFDVSRQAMQVRLVRLGIMPAWALNA